MFEEKGIGAGDLAGMADAEVEEGFAELQRASEALEAERLRWLGEIARRQSFRDHGSLSAASWLVGRFRLAWSRATGELRMARALREMPRTREAFASGRVSSSAVRVLVGAREGHSEAYSASEATLVEAARSLPIRQLRYAVAYWRQALDSAGVLEDATRLVDRRRLHVSTTLDGMVRVDGDLDPETGEVILAALRAVEDAAVRSQEPETIATPAQRQADALGQVCRRFLDSGDRPKVGGESPHLTGLVDLEALEGRASACELERSGPIHPEVARRLGCDGSVSRVVMRGASEPLDVGRRTQVVPAPPRRAVVVRDRSCRFPDCDRPRGGATPTTSITGPTQARRPSATWSCCAGPTTVWSTRAGSG